MTRGGIIGLTVGVAIFVWAGIVYAAQAPLSGYAWSENTGWIIDGLVFPAILNIVNHLRAYLWVGAEFCHAGQ